MEGHLLPSKSTDLKVNLIYKIPSQQHLDWRLTKHLDTEGLAGLMRTMNALASQALASLKRDTGHCTQGFPGKHQNALPFPWPTHPPLQSQVPLNTPEMQRGKCC